MTITDPTNWFGADTLLGKRDSRKIRHNTVLYRHANGDIAVRLHNTDVVTFHHPNGERSGQVTFSTGGWHTATTKERINRYAPAFVKVYQAKGAWYLAEVPGWDWENATHREFYDGIAVKV